MPWQPGWYFLSDEAVADVLMENKAYRPYIKIIYRDFPGVDPLLAQIRAGLEEHSVPFAFSAAAAGQEKLGYTASMESPLRVGIGVDKNKNIALFHAQAGDVPILAIEDTDDSGARVMGENAGRLVMGLPLVE